MLMGNYVTIDIGGTNIKYGLIDDQETLVEAHEIPTEAHKGGPEIMRKVQKIVADYVQAGSIEGICISSAGMVDPDKSIVPVWLRSCLAMVREQKLRSV